VQPNTSKALAFAHSFVSSGGIEALLFLLQREAKTGDHNASESSSLSSVENVLNKDSGLETSSKECGSVGDQVGLSELEEPVSDKEEPKLENARNKWLELEIDSSEDGGIKNQLESPGEMEPVVYNEGPEPESESLVNGNSSTNASSRTNIERLTSTSEGQLLKSLGGITFSINADSARNNVYNIDNGDGIVIGIIKLLGALVTSGHLKFSLSSAPTTSPSKIMNSGFPDDDNPMSDDKVSMLLFALEKAFEAAPNRLMTANVYMALLGATVGSCYYFYYPLS